MWFMAKIPKTLGRKKKKDKYWANWKARSRSPRIRLQNCMAPSVCLCPQWEMLPAPLSIPKVGDT